MPWRISSAMSQRHEFVLLAGQKQANVRQLCRQFEISPTTAYKFEIVRKVGLRGQIKYQNRKLFVGNAFARLHLALRPTTTDGLLDIYLSHQRVGSIDLKQVPKDH